MWNHFPHESKKLALRLQYSRYKRKDDRTAELVHDVGTDGVEKYPARLKKVLTRNAVVSTNLSRTLSLPLS